MLRFFSYFWLAARPCADIQDQVVRTVWPQGTDHGCGKSGGFRTIILFRIGERAVFVHGFAKNEQDNIGDDELAAFKSLAAEMLACDDKAVAKAMANGTLIEVMP